MSISYSPTGRFFSHGLAKEKVLYIDFSETIHDLKDCYFETLYNLLQDFKNHFAEHDTIIHEHFHKTDIEVKTHISVQLITSSMDFLENFRIELYEKKYSIVDAYKAAFKTMANAYKSDMLDDLFARGYMNNYKKMLRDFYDRSISYIERFVMKEVIKKRGGPCIIAIEKLRLEHLFDIPRNVKGIVFKKFIPQKPVDLRFASIFDIPIVQYDFGSKRINRIALSSYDDEVIENPNHDYIVKFKQKCLAYKYIDPKQYKVKHHSIKIYAQCGTIDSIEYLIDNPMYDAIGIYQTEYDYLTFNMMLTEAFLTERYRSVIRKAQQANKEIIFSLADIRSEKGFYLPNNITLDLIDYFKYPGMFMNQIKAIAKASEGYKKISIVVPMIYEAREITTWRLYIHDIFERTCNFSPPVGFIFETEAIFDNMEDLSEAEFDFAILGFNDLFSDLYDISPYRVVDMNQFKNYYYEDLKDVHSLLRRMKTRHLCTGNILSNPAIMTKLIKMGFTDFCIVRRNEIKTYEILKLRDENKGRYIGVHDEQVALKEYRRAILEKTGKKPPSRNLTKKKKKPDNDDENSE